MYPFSQFIVPLFVMAEYKPTLLLPIFKVAVLKMFNGRFRVPEVQYMFPEICNEPVPVTVDEPLM